MRRLPARQVHLDFHTSEYMPNVGARFSKENFQQALKVGNVNSITIFAKCHHSWCYFPTKVGMPHPTLEIDLTGAMLDAAHEMGVYAPLYITVGWSANDAENHPEWVVRDRQGNMQAFNYTLDAQPTDKRPICSWKHMCPNGDYAQHIYDLTREICARYPVVDGLFYDINFGPLCWCESCLAGMKEAGLDPDSDEDARTYWVMKWQRFEAECETILHTTHPEATLFYNGGAEPLRPEWNEWETHFEMEDLPTTWGGYDKLPPRAKFFGRTGKDMLGMSGKFHTMWGEFGGFKAPAALKYECAAMMAFGARCSIGDQMHPCGEMDLETYRLLGQAYRYVEEIEPWCFDIEQTTRLGVVFSHDSASNEGLSRMLLEKQLDFDVLHDYNELNRFDVVILPDRVYLDETKAAALNAFVANGGGLLLTGQSGLNTGKSCFLVDIGANYQGSALYENDYLELAGSLIAGVVTSPFLFYEGAEIVKVTEGEVLAGIREPYFDRTYGHYCSHQNTPYRLEQAAHPGAVLKGRVVYLAHSVCRNYFTHGAQFHRDYFINALQMVYQNPVMQVSLPSSGRAVFVKQPKENRYILHLMYATPIQRGRTSVIEDLPPIYDVPVSVEVDTPVHRVYLAPQGNDVPFTYEAGRVTLTVAKVECHQAVVFEY